MAEEITTKKPRAAKGGRPRGPAKPWVPDTEIVTAAVTAARGGKTEEDAAKAAGISVSAMRSRLKKLAADPAWEAFRLDTLHYAGQRRPATTEEIAALAAKLGVASVGGE
jgi:hypothetical protein